MTRSPDALRDRAREIVHLLGDDVPPRSIEWWFDLDDGYAEWSLRQPHAPSLADARPSAVRFNYRQSPQPIIPTRWPTRSDPAPYWSGESYVALSPQGGLLGFSRLDRQLAPPDSARAAPVDWSSLLALTGADVRGLRTVEPRWTPDVPCDARAAWVANDGGDSVRLEAAAWRGKPVWLRTIAAWERAERDSPVTPRGYTGFAFFVALVAATFFAFGALARHNLRLGRGDRRGALHVAVAIFLSFGLATSLIFRWAFDPLQVWRWMWRQPFLPALGAWLFYLGAEPFLRRRWPHRLIAWTRLLEGRLADPLVGREVLLGSLAGAAVVLSSYIPAAFERGHDVALLLSTLPLGRDADFWGSAVDALGDSLMKGLGAFAVLLLLRVLFRRDAVAWVGLGVVWALIGLPSWDITVIQWISIAVATACFVLAVRVGLVAAIVATAASNLLVCTPLTIGFSRWYGWRTGVVAVLLFGIAAWGFRAVMGRRKILSAAMFEG
jgi:hypothetical protein